MQKTITGRLFLIYYVLTLMLSCKQKDTTEASEGETKTRTPVTVTSMGYAPLQEFIELNATSSFLQKSFVKSNLIGYVQSVHVKIGDYVHKGQALFILKTKESEAIGNAINKLNAGFKFSGITTITANSDGFLAELDHQQGDYVQDGEQLAVISDSKSFAFVMNVPYEDMQYVQVGKNVEIILPGNERLTGTVSAPMPVMDSVTQTQTFAVKANVSHNIPQNLVAIIKIVKLSKTTAATLPKNSVLTDEVQSAFWVMKMLNDTTAVKVPVKKGVESGDRVEIISPEFSPEDRILLSGNYGLADTALVIVQK